MKTLLYVLYAIAAALLVAFAFLIFTSHSHAGSCGTVYFPQTYSNYAPSVIYKDNHHDDYIEKKRVVVLEYSLFPAFPVGYMPQYAPAAAPSAAPPPQAVGASTPCDDKLKGLEAKIAALESKLGGGIPPNAQPSTAPVPVTVAAKVFVAKCAGCHDASAAAAKGKNLTLFKDGAPVAWNAELTGKVLKEVAKGTMPKGGKLAQEEFASLAQELFDLSSK